MNNVIYVNFKPVRTPETLNIWNEIKSLDQSIVESLTWSQFLKFKELCKSMKWIDRAHAFKRVSKSLKVTSKVDRIIQLYNQIESSSVNNIQSIK